MKQNARVLNRFRGYTLRDCACEYCFYYGGKRAGCTLKRCCCEQERREAAAKNAGSR